MENPPYFPIMSPLRGFFSGRDAVFLQSFRPYGALPGKTSKSPVGAE